MQTCACRKKGASLATPLEFYYLCGVKGCAPVQLTNVLFCESDACCSDSMCRADDPGCCGSNRRRGCSVADAGRHPCAGTRRPENRDRRFQEGACAQAQPG